MADKRRTIQQMWPMFTSMAFLTLLIHQKPNWWLPIFTFFLIAALILFAIDIISGFLALHKKP